MSDLFATQTGSWAARSLKERALAYNRVRRFGSLSILVFVALISLFMSNDPVPARAVMVIAVDLIILTWHRWALERGDTRRSTWVTLIEAILATTVGMHLGGGAITTAVIIYAVLILTTALVFLSQTATYLSTALCALAYFAATLLEHLGLWPQINPELQRLYRLHPHLVQANVILVFLMLILFAIILGPAVTALERWNQNLERRVREQTHHLEALLDGSQQLARSLDTARVVQALVEQARHLLQARVIWYRLGENHTIRPDHRLSDEEVSTIPLSESVRAGQLLPSAAMEAPGTVLYRPVQHRERLFGILILQRSEPFSPFEQQMLNTLTQHAATALRNAELYHELEQAYLDTVLALTNAIEAKDHYTEEHSERMVELALAVGRQMGCSPESLEHLRWAAMLHDIGKIGIPEHILRKPGPLTDEERAIIQRHPIIGAEILRPIRRLEPVAALVRSHHERYDGQGYPDGLRGEEIPLEARILTAVDAYISMVDERVYDPARTAEQARAELQRCAGSHFDPQVVEALLQVLDTTNGERA